MARRLLERQRAVELATLHMRAVAQTVGVSERTVWRWVGAGADGRAGRGAGPAGVCGVGAAG
ncbi:helix-turn-helix domain-containing protein [Streptomyces sp. NPDC058542]|uniref:helix-turn-helix domain-containing protein n=1 Tax=Streptomyces sp. NPDC058542 TaxID=3346543 RepID=UPI00364BCBC9